MATLDFFSRCLWESFALGRELCTVVPCRYTRKVLVPMRMTQYSKKERGKATRKHKIHQDDKQINTHTNVDKNHFEARINKVLTS